MVGKKKSQDKALHVEHIGEFQFTVQSMSRPAIVHMVDLTAPLDKLCSCEHYQMKAGPRIRESTRKIHPLHFACSHIRATMEYLAWEKIFPIAQEKGKKTAWE